MKNNATKLNQKSDPISLLINILMMTQNVTQSEIAERLHITVPAVNSVIKGLRRNPRIRNAIADAVHWPVEWIWPEECSDKEINHTTKNAKKRQEKFQ